mmetsp:Transcript_3760/g.6995  ORF Transcript_3760/g.6995 Transcript_3760/m.6995 type:complete len:251 (-) Transcript_3760:224-976(-)
MDQGRHRQPPAGPVHHPPHQVAQQSGPHRTLPPRRPGGRRPRPLRRRSGPHDRSLRGTGPHHLLQNAPGHQRPQHGPHVFGEGRVHHHPGGQLRGRRRGGRDGGPPGGSGAHAGHRPDRTRSAVAAPSVRAERGGKRPEFDRMCRGHGNQLQQGPEHCRGGGGETANGRKCRSLARISAYRCLRKSARTPVWYFCRRSMLAIVAACQCPGECLRTKSVGCKTVVIIMCIGIRHGLEKCFERVFWNVLPRL